MSPSRTRDGVGVMDGRGDGLAGSGVTVGGGGTVLLGVGVGLTGSIRSKRI